MPLNVMLDFETLSLKPDAVLLSIGACTFDPETGEVGNEFYLAIDPRTQHQRHISADTVLWWLKQDEAARTKLTSAIEAREKLDEDGDFTDEQLTELMEQAAHPIHHVARAFILWFEQLGEVQGVWTNGGVDHVWMDSLMEYSGFKVPYPFWLQRDYRTLKGLYPEVKAEFTGTKHNALDDAIHQAKHALVLLKEQAKHEQLRALVVAGNGESNTALDIAESLATKEIGQ